MALVNAQGIEHLRISGKGTLNGNGPTYWQAFGKRRMENPRTTNLDVERPRLMFIDRCNDVRIEGIRLHDSGFWNLHMYKCRDVVIDGLEIKAPTSGNLRGPSTDGIDVDSCQNVTIRNTYISCNDDNIALKGSKGPLADKDTDSPPVENILVENCSFGDGNGIITCGSEATLVRNVNVRNCTVDGRTTVLTLKLRPDTPQHYENITIDRVVLKGGGRILNFAPWMQFFDLKGQPAPSRQVNNITLRNITGEYRTMGMIAGNVANEARTATTDVLRDITLENIDLKLADDKFLVSGVENLVVKNVTVNGKPLVVKQQAPGSGPRR
jgi:alpha-L-rhamnosidase